MGKGDKRRPTFVEEETFEERWARTFGGKPQEDPEVVSGFDPAKGDSRSVEMLREENDEGEPC